MNRLWMVCIIIVASGASYESPQRDIIPVAQSRQTLIASDGDTVYDFGGPFDYTACFCVTTTTLFGGSPFTLTFTEFAIDAPGDNITIYDGDDITAPVLYTNNTGTPFTADRSIDAFVATNGSAVIRGSTPWITIRFTADFFRGNKGFAATVNLDACADTLNLTGDLGNGTYRAVNTITTDGVVSTGNTVTLQSTTSVEMLPAFEVMVMGIFEANMEGCN